MQSSAAGALGGGQWEKARTPNKINRTERFYVENITISDTINFLVQEGSNYLESICGEVGHMLPHARQTGAGGGGTPLVRMQAVF